MLTKNRNDDSDAVSGDAYGRELAPDAAELERAIHNLSSYYGLDMLDLFITDVAQLVVKSVESGGRSGARRAAQWKMLISKVREREDALVRCTPRDE
jgi:hypothetical protein